MAIIEGTEFNNELIVTGTGDEVLGLAGNDTLDASPAQGNNTLDGGSGDDELFAGIDDLLLGGEGNDTLDANSGRGGNRLEGGEGNDLLFAATDDTLLGGVGNDILFAGREDGVLKGGTGSDQFWVVETEVPVQPNIVNRFIQTVDQIGIGGLADVTAFEDLSFEVQDGNTVITGTVEGEEVQLAILTAFTGTLTADDFIFEASPALAVPGPVAEDATFSVPENSEVRTVVGTVIATDIEITDDPEDSDALTYEIIAGNADPNGNGTAAFAIDEDTGEITVLDSGDLDFESDTTSFDLTVRVTDLEGLSDEATVTINVDDVNEAPTVEDAEFTVFSESQDGTEVGTVVATDPEGDVLTYAITGGNIDVNGDETPAFAIDTATGLITIADSDDLNLELLLGDEDPNELTDEELNDLLNFNLTVTATDSGELSSEANITINLDDGDGVSNIEEARAGDRNRDGIEDAQQSNVASVRSPVTNEFFTLVAPVGISFKNVDVVTNPAPGVTGNPEVEGFEFEDGFLTFEIEDDPNVNERVLQEGGELDISILIPENANANTYWKYDAILGWYEFTYDGETGAQFFDVDGLVKNPDGSPAEDDDNVDLVVLHFIDGGRGDDDGLANGVITDPGGVGLLATPDGSLTENGGIFTVGGTSGLAVPLTFNLIENDSAFVDEMKVFRLDESNTVLSEEVIFSEIHPRLTEELTRRELQFTAGDRLGFSIETNETPANTFSSFNNSDQVRISELENGGYNLAWEDVNLDELLFGGDFNDFVFNVEVGDTLGLDQLVAIDQGENQEELLDFRQLPGQTLQVDITVNRDAAFDNFVGFYEIDNEQGAIGNLNPGDTGYTEAAIERSRELDLNSNNTSANLDGGSLYAPFIIANGTPADDFENVYFPFIAGNADNFDHVRLLGDNVFGFEDLPNGGDQDFNDIVVALDFTLI